MAKTPKVFCSYRHVDKPAVEVFVRQLRDRGIDAWLDKWEIRPGDGPVKRINEGLAEYDVGMVFFSCADWTRKWFDAEVRTITLLQVEEGGRLIPVMLDDQAEVPPLLRRYARRSAADIDQIIDAILRHNRKPTLGPTATQPARLRVTLPLTRDAKCAVDVMALCDAKRVVQAEAVIISPALRESFGDFVRGHLKATPRGATQASATRRARDLPTLGQQLDTRCALVRWAKACPKSVRALFKLTCDIFEGPGMREAGEFAKIAVVILKQKVLPFTAKRHWLLLAGAFTDTASCREFREELAMLRAVLLHYTRLVGYMAGVKGEDDLLILDPPNGTA